MSANFGDIGISEEFDLRVISSNWRYRKCGERQRARDFSCVQFFPCMLMKRRKTTTVTMTTTTTTTSKVQEECTLSARGARRDWRERIEAACYAEEANRAGRVLETGRHSILFFSHPFLAPSALVAHLRGGCSDRAYAWRTRPTRSSSASVLPSGDIECRVNGTRFVINFANA